MDKKAYSVADFCRVFGVSKPFLYKLWGQGKGPRSYYVGRRRFISREAGAAWQHAREAESDATAVGESLPRNVRTRAPVSRDGEVA